MKDIKDLKDAGRELAAKIDSSSEEQREEISRNMRSAANKEHADFLEFLKHGKCYLCEADLVSFTYNKPCLHWLLKPKGFQKKDFERVFAKFGLFQLQSYLRWVATTEGFAVHIADEGDLKGDGKLIAVTIRYKDLEWSFSCAKGDYEGHPNSKNATMPHYHFQMRISGRPYINYNDFHVPMSHEDIRSIEAIRNSSLIKHQFNHGLSIDDLMVDENLEKIIKRPTVPSSAAVAPFKLDTIIMADEGTTIKGEDIYALIQEAKRKGVSIASLSSTLSNATARTIISPGPSTVDPAPRGKGR